MAAKLFIFFVLLSAFFLAPMSASAMTIKPVKFFVTIDPNGEQAVTITVANDGQTKKTYTAGVLGAKQNEQGTTIFSENIDEAEKWISVRPANFSLLPGQSTEVKYFIKASGLATPGAHYLGLVVREDGETFADVGIQASAAALLTVQVSGVAIEKLEIGMGTRQKIWRRNFTVDLDYKNVGNIGVGFKTNLSVTNWRGKEVFAGQVVMPSLLAKAERRAAIEVEPVGKIVFFNVYNVEANTVYGRLGQSEYQSQKIVFVSPIFIAVIILALILIAAGIFSRRKKYVFSPK